MNNDDSSFSFPTSQLAIVGGFLILTLIGSDIVRGAIKSHQFNQCVQADQKGCVEILKD